MESASLTSSSCWCCTDCIQSRLDRHSATATTTTTTTDDDDVQQAVCNGLVEECELRYAQQLCADDRTANEDTSDDQMVSVASAFFC